MMRLQGAGVVYDRLETEPNADALFTLILHQAAAFPDDADVTIRFEDWVQPFDGATMTQGPLQAIERFRIDMHNKALMFVSDANMATASSTGWDRSEVADVIVAALKNIHSGPQAVGVPEMQHYPEPTTRAYAVKDATNLLEQIETIRAHPLLSGLLQHGIGYDLWTDSLCSARDGRVTEGQWVSHNPVERATADEVLAVGADPLSHIAEYVRRIQSAAFKEQNTRVDPNTAKARAFFDHTMRGLCEVALHDGRKDADWPFVGIEVHVYDLAAILFEAGTIDAKRVASASRDRMNSWAKQHKERWLSISI